MQSKFWAAGSESSDSGYEQSEPDEPQIEQKRPLPSRWAAVESSSSEDEERVARSLKDRRWGAMRSIITKLENHMKINDFSELYKDYEALLKCYHKSSNIVEQEGVPRFFIRCLVSLEDMLEEKHRDRENFKKLSKAKALAFNTLRAKVRKNNEVFASEIEKCRNDPGGFISSESDEDDLDSMISSDEEESVDESEDESLKKKKDDLSDSDREGDGDDEDDEDDEDWGMDDDDEDADEDDEDKHKKAMQKWGIQTEKKKKKEESATKEKKKKTSSSSSRRRRERELEEKEEKENIDAGITMKDIDALFDAPDVSPEIIRKKALLIVEKRGRRGVDKVQQTKLLLRLCEIAQRLKNSQLFVEIMMHLISSEFDTTSGVYTCVTSTTWIDIYNHINEIEDIIEANDHIYLIPVLLAENEDLDEDEKRLKENDDDDSKKKKSDKKENEKKSEETTSVSAASEKYHLVKLHQSFDILTSYIERLDDELTKALQLTDIHSEEYRERLGQSVDMICLLWKSYCFFAKNTYKKCCATIALRVNEHMHYKHDTIASRMWEIVKRRIRPDLAEKLPVDNEHMKPHQFVQSLAKVVFASDVIREKIRGVLHVCYSKSLHDDYYDARDILSSPYIHEACLQSDISTQILYNRNIVQLGLCAFRKGLISEAHACLSEVCPKHKELLAQGLSNLKNVDKTPEQERTEKRRLLPYHMHISMELIEGAHNICAMLLEVPHMARDPYENRKKPISKHFRRMLDAYYKQVFLGPPENARDTVMAATRALQKGEWKDCCKYIKSLNICEKMQNKEQIQDMLTKKIQEEAMRTYVFTYIGIYASFCVTELCDMFDLSESNVHSIISKMMINEEIHASWDETSQYIIISKQERTRLQQLSFSLAENVSSAVEQNELTLNMKNPKFALTHEKRYSNRDGDRYGWGDRDKMEHSHRRGGYKSRGGLLFGTRGRGRRGRAHYQSYRMQNSAKNFASTFSISPPSREKSFSPPEPLPTPIST